MSETETDTDTDTETTEENSLADELDDIHETIRDLAADVSALRAAVDGPDSSSRLRRVAALTMTFALGWLAACRFERHRCQSA